MQSSAPGLRDLVPEKRMPPISARLPLAAALAAVLAGASACAPLRSHQGYVVDSDLVDSVQPGVDTRDSVQQVLGRPTVQGQFTDRDWYYISRDSRNYAFNQPNAKDQLTLRVHFDADGKVTAVERSGLELASSVNPSNKTTPTLGRKRSFFEDLFGNIGTVGAPGMGGGGPDQ
jgi:outer membrane protein assembly factor BamE (lipoprotein component of BamABCDE complex)